MNFRFFSSHADGMFNILLTLPGTTDFNIQNIVNLRTVIAKSAFAVTSFFSRESQIFKVIANAPFPELFLFLCFFVERGGLSGRASDSEERSRGWKPTLSCCVLDQDTLTKRK